MMASWTITAPGGRLVALGTQRGLLPQNAADAYDLAAGVAHGLELALLAYLRPEPNGARDDGPALTTTWALTLANGQPFAAGSPRSPTPLNGFEAYALAAGVAEDVERALLDYVGPRQAAGDDTLPLPMPTAAE